MTAAVEVPDPSPARVSLGVIAWEWARIGCIGFGGPPTHIALLRRLCVERRGWIGPGEFEDGIATTALLPGPASTQLAILCAWRLRSTAGAIIGGLCFIVPGLALILALSAVFLAGHPAHWVLGAAAGAGAAVPAVAVRAASVLVPASRARIGRSGAQRARWLAWAAAGAAGAALAGQYLVLVLVACGVTEIAARRDRDRPTRGGGVASMTPAIGAHASASGLGALAWVALKVGALSYGGGFVIVPLMQHDAVSSHHWMTGTQFLNAVALGQVTPGPVVHTVAVIGYAAGGLTGSLLAATVAFTPSFLFVIIGGPRFDQIRANTTVQAFLTGAGAAVVGAIAGSAIPLALALTHLWQAAMLGMAALWLLVLRNNVVAAIIGAAILGIVATIAGAPTSP